MIKIYQINMDRDKDGFAFLSTFMLEGRGQKKVDLSIYDMVYECDLEVSSLESVFTVFNLFKPSDFKGWSLSTSDIVEAVGHNGIKDGLYFCDAFGWKRVDKDGSFIK